MEHQFISLISTNSYLFAQILGIGMLLAFAFQLTSMAVGGKPYEIKYSPAREDLDEHWLLHLVFVLLLVVAAGFGLFDQSRFSSLFRGLGYLVLIIFRFSLFLKESSFLVRRSKITFLVYGLILTIGCLFIPARGYYFIEFIVISATVYGLLRTTNGVFMRVLFLLWGLLVGTGLILGLIGWQVGYTLISSLVALMISAVGIKRLRDRVNEAEKIENQLEFLAYHDQLTGLGNRKCFYRRLQASVLQTVTPQWDESSDWRAVLIIDVDHFKHVNDSAGNEIGNILLIRASQLISEVVPDSSLVFRTGGDEFAIILEGMGSELDAAMVAEKILGTLVEPFVHGDHRIYISLSIGITIYPRDGSRVEEITANADHALQEAKIDRNTYRFYTPSMQERAVSRIQFINYLRQAIDRKEMYLAYQPQVSLEGRVTGAEVLLRWHHPVLGQVSPTEFIPIAEETGLILAIGSWVIEQTCYQLSLLHQEGFQIPLAVNLSPKQVKDVRLQRTIIAHLRRFKLRPEFLHLEITENSLLENAESLISKIQNLADLGFTFSIDDFGTGYSSLSYLKRLPIATVKIDRSFIIDLPHNNQDAALVEAIISMVHGLGLSVVAEGVDTVEQLEFLREKGCGTLQGYLFSKPLEFHEFIQFLRKPPKTFNKS